jgi:cell division protein FtsI/penicillin-binding protein 2
MPTLALLAASSWLAQLSTVVLRVTDGHVVRRRGPQAERRPPGSTLKPFVLAALLRSAGFDPQRRIACAGRMTIAGRRLDCTHGPAVASVNGVEAIAYSCNRYFAETASRAHGLTALLREYGFRPRTPSTPDELRLQAIGEWGVDTTPDELARTYRQLALLEDRPELAPVFEGLRMAVTAGTARNAGPDFAGKTGTTASASGLSLDAWFAGFTPPVRPRHVVAIFVPGGRGAIDAAPLAREALRI